VVLLSLSTTLLVNLVAALPGRAAFRTPAVLALGAEMTAPATRRPRSRHCLAANAATGRPGTRAAAHLAPKIYYRAPVVKLRHGFVPRLVNRL